ncbi:MAG: flagellar hook-associated protein FlgK [Deltaproteobacteria bacterium]|jgi:flagellar hook-associated protein 1 FlgK|nr:flagellar hook-associated protein FlgK [Deltaproteobacteria bacterium]
MGVSSAMYTALTGMRLSQTAMEVASNNISNVNTQGYSRQRVNLATLPSVNQSYGQMGLGVNADNISRYTDQFLVRSLTMTGATLGHHLSLKNSLDNLEIFYNESDGNGINQAMNDFFDSFSQLADEASNIPYREELIEYAQNLTTQLSLRRQEMDELRKDTNARINDAVIQVNYLITEIATLNQQISVAEDPALNRQANDLRDSREELTRQLAEYMNIDFYEDPHDGQYTITSSSGIPLVLKTTSFALTTVTNSDGDVNLKTTHNQYWMEDITASVTEGALGGWLEFREEVLLDYYRQYDSFVDGLIFNINDQHAQGAGEALFTEAVATTDVSNLCSTEIVFPGEDNDIRISSLVPHLASREPYDDFYSDPENIEIKFVKSDITTSEITSSVKFNDDPNRMKWEITITLPTDSNGNVSVSARELCAYINSEKSSSVSDGVNYLPPRTSAWKVGDFISAEGVMNQGDSGRINFSGSNLPQELNTFFTLDRSLKYVLPQGQHLSYGLEYAELKTNFKHTNNDVIFTSNEKGAAGEALSLEYRSDGGANRALSVEVISSPDGGQNIVVNLATDNNGMVVTTAGDIVNAINSHHLARTLVTAQTPLEENGLGVVEAMEKTYLDRSGYFTLAVYKEGDEPIFHKITVNPDDKLEDIVKQIGTTFDQGVTGLRLETITDRHGRDQVRIIADEGYNFGYAGDNSGILATLGLNNILTGHNGADVGVNQLLIDNRDYINAAHINSNGVIANGDNTNALNMSELRDKRFSFYHQASATLGSEFNGIYSNIGAAVRGATTDYNFTEGIYSQLQDRLDSIAGVNLDEELADILRFQYMYQASAKMISTIDTMMETLLAMK